MHPSCSLELRFKLIDLWLRRLQRTRVVHEQWRSDVAVFDGGVAFGRFCILFVLLAKFIQEGHRISPLDLSFLFHSSELSVQLEEFLLDLLHFGTFVV